MVLKLCGKYSMFAFYVDFDVDIKLSALVQCCKGLCMLVLWFYMIDYRFCTI